MATAAEIRDKAARKLGILGVGNTLRAEHQADLDEAYLDVYNMLAADDLTPWDFDEEVPDDLVEPVVSLVAYARYVDYGVPQERSLKIVRDAEGAPPTGVSLGRPAAISVIKQMLKSNTYEPIKSLYF
jgi:hypothetical protein